jgi:hypothetical protein
VFRFLFVASEVELAYRYGSNSLQEYNSDARSGASKTGGFPDASKTQSESRDAESCRACCVAAVALSAIALYFLLLTSTIFGLVCAFIGIAIVFYILNAIQYVCRTAGNDRSVDRTYDGRGSDAACIGNCCAAMCAAIGLVSWFATHVVWILGMALIHTAACLLRCHADDIDCVGHTLQFVDGFKDCFSHAEVTSADPGTTTYYY